MRNDLARLGGNALNPFSDEMSAFELLYNILLVMERMAEALEKSAAIHEKMLEQMTAEPEMVSHAEYV